MLKNIYDHFISILLISLIGLCSLSAEVKDIEKIVSSTDLWKSNLDDVKKQYPSMDWKKSDVNNVYQCNKEGLFLWLKPVSELQIYTHSESKLVQTLCVELISSDKVAKFSKKKLGRELAEWSKLLSSKFSSNRIVLPKVQFGDDKYQRVGWSGKLANVVLAVVSNPEGKRVKLLFHEKKHGAIRFKLKGKQAEAAKIAGQNKISKPVAKNSTKRVNRKMSWARTPALKEEYGLKENFDGEWPKLVKAPLPEIKIIKESKEEKKFIYHSPNYEFICDVRVSKNIIKNFSKLFEATRLYCQELPVFMARAHLSEGSHKFKILLFETKASYFKNGGPPGSAGVFMSGKGVVMVPLVSLGVKKVGSSYMYDYKKSNKTLSHEIAHQLANLEYFSSGAMGWFSEGLAEYVGATKYKSGKFMVNSSVRAIKAYVTAGSRKDGRGRHLGDKISAPNLKNFMLMTYKQFTANGNFNYGLGALITTYFFHFDKDGDRKNINAFLNALINGKKGEDAIKFLLDGRTFEQLEEDITKEWRRRGVKITFK